MTEALRNQLELTHLGHVAATADPDPELDSGNESETETESETPAAGPSSALGPVAAHLNADKVIVQRALIKMDFINYAACLAARLKSPRVESRWRRR